MASPLATISIRTTTSVLSVIFQKLKTRVEELSGRNIGLMLMLCVYAIIAILVADGRLQLVMSALPIMLVVVATSLTQRVSPSVVSVIGMASFALATLINDISWSPITYLLFVIQLVIVVIHGLIRVEMQALRTARAKRERGEDGLVPEVSTRQVIARELRRSRRMKSPLSVLLVSASEAGTNFDRQPMIEFLTSHTREFDKVFELPHNEFGILCINTDRSEATHYVERMRKLNKQYLFSLASFPDDAVTSQGLLDFARKPLCDKTELDVVAAID